MPRGGARKKPGPKPKLEWIDKISVGARFEELWREKKLANEIAAVSAATETVAVEWSKVQAIPVSERKKWLASAAYDDHVENVEYALQQDQGLQDHETPSRIVQIKPKRLNGLRKQIIAEVATLESFERGVEITPRMVETCLKEFRKLEQELRD